MNEPARNATRFSLWLASCLLALDAHSASTSGQSVLGQPMPSDHREWLACAENAECTSVELGCYYWQPVNKNFVAKMKNAYPVVCASSHPAGPRPPSGCVKRLCVNRYTVGYWRLLKTDADASFSIVNSLVAQQMNSCLHDVALTVSQTDFVRWRDQIYIPRIEDAIIQQHLNDGEPLDSLMNAVIPCKLLRNWQEQQQQWEEIQAKNSPSIHVRIENIPDKGALDLGALYPPLIKYGTTLRECGQRASRAGSTFWGDIHAHFTIQADGRVDPASLENRYPATANMRSFIDCAETSIKALAFPQPRNQQPINVRALIEVRHVVSQ